MPDPQQKVVKVGDDVIAFPGDLEDAHVAKLIKSFRAEKSKVPNSQYAKPGPYKTDLAPDKETQFQDWAKTNKVPWQDTPTADYDMRGYWQAMVAGDKNAKQAPNKHFPDTWKTPYHKSFSNESKYALPTAPKWNDKDQLVDSTGKVVFDERAAQQAIKPKMPIATEESEHARQLKPAQPLSSAIPSIPNWANKPMLDDKALEETPKGQAITAKSQASFEAQHPKITAAINKGNNPAILGGLKGTNEFIKGMTSPANAALMLAAPESKILSGIFSVQAMKGSFRDAQEAKTAFEAGNNEEAMNFVTQALLGAGIAGAAGAHAYKGLPEGARTKLGSKEGSVPVEPFAYGHTPERRSVARQTADIQAKKDEFDKDLSIAEAKLAKHGNQAIVSNSPEYEEDVRNVMNIRDKQRAAAGALDKLKAASSPRTYEEVQTDIDKREERFDKEKEPGVDYYFPENANLLRPNIYTGPEIPPNQLRKANLDSSALEEQARNIAKAMKEGKTFKEAMESEGSIALAEKLGGTLTRDENNVLPGYKPYPKDMVDLYAERDAIGSGQLKQSLGEITSKVKAAGITDDAEIRHVLEYYALDPNRTDVGKQYLAAQHTQAMVDQPPQRQVERAYSALAAERGIPMDDHDDLFRDRKTTQDAVAAVKAIHSYFYPGTEINIKGVLPEPKPEPLDVVKQKADELKAQFQKAGLSR